MKELVIKGSNEVEVKDFSLVDKWLRFAQVKPTSEKSYRKGIKNFANFLREIGIDNPCSVTREIALEYRSYLEKNYKSPYTRNLYITATKLFFVFLNDDLKIINDNPTIHIKGFDCGRSHKKDAITPADNAKILHNFDTSTLKGKRDYALYAIMSVTGIRTIEASRARIENLREGDNGEIYLWVKGKGHDTESDCVHVPAPVMVILQSYLDARGELPLDAPLFASLSNRNYGKAISTGTISTIIKNIFRENGINKNNKRKISAHSLRHGAATTALKNGATLRQVQQFLRHTSIDVTTRYLHDMDRANNPSESLCASAFGLV